jgi:hypothetical protein
MKSSSSRSSTRFKKQTELTTEMKTVVAQQWLCLKCLHAEDEILVNQVVDVWWNDDQRAYRGEVTAYDSLSRSHRVLYIDGQWEFLQLENEAYKINLKDVELKTEKNEI